MVVGELVGLDEVGGPHRGAVEAELRGDRVHGPLHDEAALRTARAAVGGHHHGVGEQRLELHAVGARLVGAEQLGRGDDRHDQAVRRVGAVVVPERHVEPQHATVVVEADLDVVHLAALVGGGDEVLAPVLGELHRPAQRPRRHRHEQLLGPRVVDLDAEPATHVGGDDVDLGEVEAQSGGDAPAHPGRGLGGAPHREPARVGVPAGDDPAALHRLARAALDRQVEGEPARRGGDRRRGVAVVLLHPGPDVARHVVVHEVRRGPGRLDADHRRQEVVGRPGSGRRRPRRRSGRRRRRRRSPRRRG